MKVVKFMGGLGNQLFQYVFLRKLEIEYNLEVKADFSYFEEFNDIVRQPRILKFNVKLDFVSSDDLASLLHLNLKKEKKYIRYKLMRLIDIMQRKGYYFHHSTEYIDPSRILSYSYYEGYWQSYKYLAGIEDTITREVTLKNQLGAAARRWINFLSSENSIFIGIRLGDYLNGENKAEYGILGLEYYTRAIDVISTSILNPTFVVFSDDIELVKETFKELSNRKNVMFFDSTDVSDEEELIIRASCKHAIISNSTYNWWGAWLIPGNDKMVIAPRQWYADGRKSDIVPPDWITI